jgi:hypothetical protein
LAARPVPLGDVVAIPAKRQLGKGAGAMKKSRKRSFVSRLNEILAMRITMLVGTIWAFYVFVIFGLTPLFWPGYQNEILYWSNFLQLIFLPIITVGTALLSRNSEARAVEDHKTIRKEFALLQEAHELLGHSLHEIALGVRVLLERSQADGHHAAPSGSHAPSQPAAADKSG